MVKTINIAIDGPSGAGKSSVAKEVARIFHFEYVDTGAIYRTVGYYFILNHMEPTDKTVAEHMDKIDIKVVYENHIQKVMLNGVDVSDKIRTPEASMMASKVSAFSLVREKLLSVQRDIALVNNVIMDGRDIGTTILPQADLKIFLTASVSSRAERRYRELIAQGEQVSLAAVEEDIQKRDYHDSHRQISPLKQAEDAILIDTSDLSLAESVETVAHLIRRNVVCGGIM